MAQILIRVSCQAVVLLLVLLLVGSGQLRGLQAASYCKAKLAEEGFGLEDASWADPVHTIDLRAEFAQLLRMNGVNADDTDLHPGTVSFGGRSLPFLVKGGGEDPALQKGVGLNGSLASRSGTFLVLGLSLPNPLQPSSRRGVYELPQAEVTFYIGIGEGDSMVDGGPPPRWRASAGYLMPSRPKKQERCADGSSSTVVHLSHSHLVCLELCRSESFSGDDDCQVGVSLTLPAVRDAHSMAAEGTIESLRLEGDPLHFQPTALTTWGWRGKHNYSLLPEVASWCPAVDRSGAVGASGSSYIFPGPCQQVIADTLFEWGGGWDLFGSWARSYRRPGRKVFMHATLNPSCLQGTGSYLECGPFEGISIVSNLVLETRNFDCFEGRFSARFAMTAVKPGSSSSWQQGSLLSGSGSQETEPDHEDVLFEFVAEGLVSVGDRSLCMVACWKRRRQDPSAAEICEDCRIGMELQGPGRGLTILDRNTVTVTLTSLRTKTDPFFFNALTFRGHLDIEKNTGNLPGVASKYMYTKVDVAPLVCDDSVADAPSNHSIFPAGQAIPYAAWTTFRAETFYSDHRPENYDLQDPSNFSGGGHIQLDSYHMNFGCGVHDGSKRSLQRYPGFDCVARRVNLYWPKAFGHTTMDYWYMEAEGTYHPVQRRLCLIACRSVLPLLVGEKNVTGLEGETSKDCQMSLTAVLTSYRNEDGQRIIGTFRSLRDPSDPLYFKPVVLQASYKEDADIAEASLFLRDFEVLESLVAISLSILCILAQLRHSHRKPQFVPHLSLTMLCTLTAGYAIPLVWGYDALMFLHRLSRGNGGSDWNTGELEVLLGVLAMLAVLLLLRLIWRVSSARKLGEETRATWNEAKVLLISVALYLLGWVIVEVGAPDLPTAYFQMDPGSSAPLSPLFFFIRKDLEKCAGLILDWFLLPQVVANVVWNAGPVQPVSHVFYWGLTLGRAFLHVHYIVVRRLSDIRPRDFLASEISLILAVVVSIQACWAGRRVSPPADGET